MTLAPLGTGLVVLKLMLITVSVSLSVSDLSNRAFKMRLGVSG